MGVSATDISERPQQLGCQDAGQQPVGSLRLLPLRLPLSAIAVQNQPRLRGGERGAQDRCMTRFQNPPDGISQEALADLVTEAVRQALAQYGVLLDAEALLCASA